MDDGNQMLSHERKKIEKNEEDNGHEPKLTIDPFNLSPTSRKGTSIPSPKRPLTKPHPNLLNIDPNATLAAISARLATLISAPETEFARVNRETHVAMTNGSVFVDSHGKKLMPQSNFEDQSHFISTNISSRTSKDVMTPALYDSIIAEEWVNLHLETNKAFLLPVGDTISTMKNPIVDNDDELVLDSEVFVFRRGGDGGPLGRAGMDRGSMYRMGMSKELVDRLYRALYVYTNGFHNLINEIASHCSPQFESHVSSNVWLAFLQLLEQCEHGKHEIALLKFKQAAQSAQDQLQSKCQRDIILLDSQLRSAQSALINEIATGAEKTAHISKLVATTTESTLKIAEQEEELAAQAEQIRLLKLEILVHEDEERKVKEDLNDARRRCDVANSARVNALTDRNAKDEEIRELSNHLKRFEAEKTSYAKRVRDTLVSNQDIRTKADRLKQIIVGLRIETDKAYAEKQSLQEQVEKAQLEICRLQALRAQSDREFVENQNKHNQTEAQLRMIAVNFDKEVEHNVKYQQEIANLTAQIVEEKERSKAWEIKCNILTAEKLNAGMREQDKQQIECLLDQKTELEAVVEANTLDQKRNEEQIQTLNLSIEALNTELQHTKRVFSTGEQAFLHSERTCDQLRLQNQELEKNNVKAKKNIASLKERLKMHEKAAKEQITKLEVEIKVTSAQLRETTYINNDNIARVEQLTHTLLQLEKELAGSKTRTEELSKQVAIIQAEKEGMQRSQDLATSTFQKTIHQFAHSLQIMLTLVKVDEFPLDEAIRELLQMVQDTFGKELNLDKLVEDDDTPVTIELEVQEDVTKEEHASCLKRASVYRNSVEGINNDEESNKSSHLPSHNTCAEKTCTQHEIIRMSRFRKSKLDHLVTKLQSKIASNEEQVANLQSAIMDQTREIYQLTSTTRQQTCLIGKSECQKEMLQSDLEMTTLKLIQVFAEKQAVTSDLKQARLDQALSDNHTFQVQVALATLRREYDKQVIVDEDALGHMWRLHEHNLYMCSLRRNKDVQATATPMDQTTQTLVPQRNPALERPRVPSQLIPSEDYGSSEKLLQKISRATRELLPGVAHEMDLRFQHEKSKLEQQHEGNNASCHLNVHSRNLAQASQNCRQRHFGKFWTIASDNELGVAKLPPVNVKRISAFPPSHVVYHVNEFGTRQNVLVSPTQVPFVAENRARRSLSPRPPLQISHVQRPIPCNSSTVKGSSGNDLRYETQDEERVESGEDTQPQYIGSLDFLTSQSSPTRNNINMQSSNRKVVREISWITGSRNSPTPHLIKDHSDEYGSLSFPDKTLSDGITSNRLAAVVSMHNREKLSFQDATWRAKTESSRHFVNFNHDDKEHEVRSESTTNTDLAMQDRYAQLFPGVLYPIIPNL